MTQAEALLEDLCQAMQQRRASGGNLLFLVTTSDSRQVTTLHQPFREGHSRRDQTRGKSIKALIWPFSDPQKTAPLGATK